MSSLGDWVEKFITGTPGGVSLPTWREQLRHVEDVARSGRKAAKLAGVAESTWRGWRKGSKPKAAGLGKIQATYRATSARRVENGDIKMVVEYPNRRGKRRSGSQELTARNLKMNPGAAQRIRAAYIQGGKEEGAAQMLREVKDPFYRKWITPDSLGSAVRGSGANGSGGGGNAGGGNGGAGGSAGDSGGGGGGGGSVKKEGGGDDFDFEEYDYDLDSDYGGNILS